MKPHIMGIGPVSATRKALSKAGLTLADIGLVELNEAFAAQYLACERALGLKREITNVNGGGIALGHPVGCTGARITTTLTHEMRKRGTAHGLATLAQAEGWGRPSCYADTDVRACGWRSSQLILRLCL